MCKKNEYRWKVDSVGAGDNFKARIDVLTIEETEAVVRVLEEGRGLKLQCGESGWLLLSNHVNIINSALNSSSG